MKVVAHLLAEVVLFAFPEYNEGASVNEDPQRIIITLERTSTAKPDAPSIEAAIRMVVGPRALQNDFVACVSKR